MQRRKQSDILWGYNKTPDGFYVIIAPFELASKIEEISKQHVQLEIAGNQVIVKCKSRRILKYLVSQLKRELRRRTNVKA